MARGYEVPCKQMSVIKHDPKAHPARGNHSPYTMNAPSQEEVRKHPPRKGETTTDDLGATWGESSKGIVVRHN